MYGSSRRLVSPLTSFPQFLGVSASALLRESQAQVQWKAFVTTMEFDNAQSITFGEAALPCFHRGFVRSIDSRIFWTLHTMHFELGKVGSTAKLNKFVDTIVSIVGTHAFVDDADVLKRPDAKPSGGVVPFNLASTLAVMTTMSASIALNQVKQPVKQIYEEWLRAACKFAAEAMVTQSIHNLDIDVGDGFILHLSSRTTIVDGTPIDFVLVDCRLPHGCTGTQIKSIG